MDSETKTKVGATAWHVRFNWDHMWSVEPYSNKSGDINDHWAVVHIYAFKFKNAVVPIMY